jgi:hypothetical protein
MFGGYHFPSPMVALLTGFLGDWNYVKKRPEEDNGKS